MRLRAPVVGLASLATMPRRSDQPHHQGRVTVGPDEVHRRERSRTVTATAWLLVAGLTLAVEYEMGGEAKVGGDWYDALTTVTGKIALVVGDVVGRGVPAVAAMTRYRYGLKALLSAGHPPGEALSMLNRTATADQPLADDGFATVICSWSRNVSSCTLIGLLARWKSIALSMILSSSCSMR